MRHITRFPTPTGVPRRAIAFTLLLLLAFLASGCHPALSASGTEPPRAVAISACEEGLIAARAWDCLSSGMRGHAGLPETATR